MGITNNIPPSRLIQPGVIDNTAARPASPFEGQCIFQKDTDQLLVWNGTAWVIPNSPAQNPMGLELVKIQTVGTGVASQLVSNAFNSTYDNYRVVISGVTTSANGENFAVRTLASAGNYRYSGFYIAYTTSTITGTGVNTADYVPIAFTTSSSAYLNYLTCEIYAPFLTYCTRFTATNASGAYNTNFNGLLADTTSTTDLTVLVGAGTMTGGTISVYGYRK